MMAMFVVDFKQSILKTPRTPRTVTPTPMEDITEEEEGTADSDLQDEIASDVGSSDGSFKSKLFERSNKRLYSLYLMSVYTLYFVSYWAGFSNIAPSYFVYTLMCVSKYAMCTQNNKHCVQLFEKPWYIENVDPCKKWS